MARRIFADLPLLGLGTVAFVYPRTELRSCYRRGSGAGEELTAVPGAEIAAFPKRRERLARRLDRGPLDASLIGGACAASKSRMKQLLTS